MFSEDRMVMRGGEMAREWRKFLNQIFDELLPDGTSAILSHHDQAEQRLSQTQAIIFLTRKIGFNLSHKPGPEQFKWQRSTGIRHHHLPPETVGKVSVTRNTCSAQFAADVMA